MEKEVAENKDELKDKLSPYEQQEAYFMLCEIFTRAQATQNKAQFEYDLSQWKKRFNLDLFGEEYRHKIKYMLSQEFLDTIIKNFSIFMKQSQKDPAEGLEKLRKILDKAEKNKDKQQFKVDMKQWDLEYSSERLKNIYPHIISLLLSKSNIARVFQKFDYNLAFTELKNITQNSQNFSNVKDYTSAIEEWKKLYPTADFSDKYKSDVERLLTDALDSRNLEVLFPISTEIDLSEGEVIPLELQESAKSINKISKDALHDFFKIVDKNKGDIDSLFDWVCKYNIYINSFDSTIKAAIVDNLMTKYAYELPPVGTIYRIPKMKAGINDLLSLSEFDNIDDTKKQVVLQLLGILSTGKELTHEDMYQLNIINANVAKSEMIKESTIEQDLEDFMRKNPEDNLTPHDAIYIQANSPTRMDVSIKDDVDLTVHKTDTNTIEIENVTVHEDISSEANEERSETYAENSTESQETVEQENAPDSFKETIKVIDVVEPQIIIANSTGTSDSGATGGGAGVSISGFEKETTMKDDENIDETPEKSQKENTIISLIDNTQEQPETTIQAIVLESETINEITTTTEVSIEENKIAEPEEETPSQKNPIKDFLSHFMKRDLPEDGDREDR